MSTITATTHPSQEAKALAFLKNLKLDTEPQHLQLEQQPLLAAIMQPAVTVQQYATYLFIMQSIEQAYEAVILPATNFLFPPMHAMPASQRIAADMNAIGIQVHEEAFIPYRLDTNYSIPFHLGFRYVMEGSKLGGKVIYKHIQKTLGFTGSNGASFLADTGADTGNAWKTFLHHFSHYIIPINAEAEAIAGARFAFDSIYTHYQNNRMLYAD